MRKECEESVFPKQNGLATWPGLSREFKSRANNLANLGLLSCNATAGMTLQLLACLARVQLLVACKPPEVAHMPSMPEVEASCQLEHYRTKSIDWPFSYLAAGTHDLVKPLASSILKNLTLHIPLSP